MKEKNENIEFNFGNSGDKYPFRVPEEYFETFSDRLKFRIEQEESPKAKRTLVYYLRPALSIAASIAAVVFLIYMPLRNFNPANNGYIAGQHTNIAKIDSSGSVADELISNLSDGQFLSAILAMDEYEKQTIAPDSLVEYIAANYTDFEIIVNK